MAKRTPVNEEPEGFADFWTLWRPYARKNDCKGDAREAFRKALERGHNPEDIVLGAAWHLRTLTSEEDRKFIQLAATWINKGGFEDKCDDERRHRAAIEQYRLKQTRGVVVEAVGRPSEAEHAALVARRIVLPDNHFSKRWQGKQ